MSMEEALRAHTNQDDLRFKELADGVGELKVILIRMEERHIRNEKHLERIDSSMTLLQAKVEALEEWRLKNEEFIEILKDERTDTKRILMNNAFKIFGWLAIIMIVLAAKLDIL